MRDRTAEIELERIRSDFEEFARAASHSLSEPLAVAAGYARLLVERYGDALDEDARRFVRPILSSLAAAQNLLDELRAYSHVSTRGGPYERVDVSTTVDEAVRLLRPSLQASSASLEVGSLPAIYADRGQLVLLFRALLSNALRFRSADPPRIAIDVERDGGCWRFNVSDNGVGVPEADRERIFRMLEHADREGRPSGSGAGLAISRRIVERHGGAIWVEPVEGGGSAFKFTLRERQEAAR